MKYLKEFENYYYADIKKYFVLDSENYYYVMTRIQFVVHRMYVYLKGSGELHKDEGAIYDVDKIDKNRIIYMSDDLQDVLGNLPYLSNTKKYNL